MAENPFSGNDISKPLPEWQIQLIDQRLEVIANSPERLRPIDELFDVLDHED